MIIGKLRHLVSIQTSAETKDTFGQPVLTWTTTAQRYASIEPLSGRELERARQIQPDITHKVTMRHYEGLNTKQRISFDSRIFYITQVLNPEERSLQTSILAIEQV